MWSTCVNDNFMFFRSRPSTYIVSVYNQVDDVARVGRQSANSGLGDEVFQLLQTEEKFPLTIMNNNNNNNPVNPLISKVVNAQIQYPFHELQYTHANLLPLHSS